MYVIQSGGYPKKQILVETWEEALKVSNVIGYIDSDFRCHTSFIVDDRINKTSVFKTAMEYFEHIKYDPVKGALSRLYAWEQELLGFKVA